ncbi:Tol-Pal system-associated acyl-CoA thioesterase [hydrothermal vent metagenome]|uniref:Tol-Pal system-associated acyl-CoA thioesterase n=1 Tax=hydrothermal vent metagenome TaxID=652676 RepID=A0A3B0TWM6_9ZZZZ
MNNKAHRFPVRIYYEDTDFSGNVYHAAYLKFMERARTELLRQNDIHHFELAKQGMAFAVARLEISYMKPAHIDDILEVVTEIKSTKGARFILEQEIFRGDTILTRSSVTVVAIGENGRPVRLPAGMMENLSQ